MVAYLFKNTVQGRTGINLLIHATAWNNLKIIAQSWSVQVQWLHAVFFHVRKILEMKTNGYIYNDRMEVSNPLREADPVQKTLVEWGLLDVLISWILVWVPVCMHMLKFIKLYALNMFHLWYFSCITIKLSKKLATPGKLKVKNTWTEIGETQEKSRQINHYKLRLWKSAAQWLMGQTNESQQGPRTPGWQCHTNWPYLTVRAKSVCLLWVWDSH